MLINFLGESYLKQEMKFECKPCGEAISPDADAMTEHCKSQKHYEKVSQFIKSMKVTIFLISYFSFPL